MHLLILRFIYCKNWWCWDKRWLRWKWKLRIFWFLPSSILIVWMWIKRIIIFSIKVMNQFFYLRLLWHSLLLLIILHLKLIKKHTQLILNHRIIEKLLLWILRNICKYRKTFEILNNWCTMRRCMWWMLRLWSNRSRGRVLILCVFLLRLMSDLFWATMLI